MLGQELGCWSRWAAAVGGVAQGHHRSCELCHYSRGQWEAETLSLADGKRAVLLTASSAWRRQGTSM